MKKLNLLVLLVFLSTAILAQSASEKKLASAVETLRQLMINPDSALLNKIISDKLSYGHSGGKVEGKQQFIGSLLKKQSDFETIDLTNQEIIIEENTGIVRHLLTATTNDNGQPGSVKINIMLIWLKQKGEWKLLGRQAIKTS